MSNAISTTLLVEDNAGDARLVREMFNEQGQHTANLVHTQTMFEAETYLARHAVDMILLDLGLPDAQGLNGVRRAQVAAPRAPLVVLTGLDDEALAADALREGAQDYLIKGQIEARGLMRALRYAIERKIMEETARNLTKQITHSAEHDFLTGLPNRVLLNDRIDFAIALAARNAKKVAVLFLDLDGFKKVNDSLGHAAGDKLLQSVAGRLVSCVRGADAVSRQGGDEFVVLLSELARSDDAAIVARKMIKAIAKPHAIDHRFSQVTASIGVSVYPDDGVNAEALIKNADKAMYQAKQMGRKTFRFFKPSMNDRTSKRELLEEELRGAMKRNELSLYYQPKMDLRTGTISGAEALIRWTHPTLGLIAPAQFIPVAEDCGLIGPIGAWVLTEACRQARVWLKADLPLGSMSVNISTTQVNDDGFVPLLCSILDEPSLDPRLLELEFQESGFMKRRETVNGALQSLRKQGVQIVIDDFGTGHSSLMHFWEFPVDKIKIDPSFIRNIDTISGATTAVSAVSAVIGMARALQLRVVGEGVETKEQLAFLTGQDCDEAQGYYLCRPMMADAFTKLLGTGLRQTPNSAALSCVNGTRRR